MQNNISMETSQNILNLFRAVRKNIIRNFDILHKTELSPQQLHALFIIKDNDTIAMSLLAKEMLISKQQLTPIVDLLIKRSYVHKITDTNDRRLLNLSLSPAGHQFITRHTENMLLTINNKLQAVAPEKLQSFNKAALELRKMIEEVF